MSPHLLLNRLQGSPLGTLIDSIKDTLLAIKRYHQQTATPNQSLEPRVFKDVPIIEASIYVGFDMNDIVWDSARLQHRINTYFQLLIGDLPIQVKLARMSSFKHSPNWIWNEITRMAYDDGNHYFFQMNDDLTFHSKHWLVPAIYNIFNRPFKSKLKNFGSYGINSSLDPRVYEQMMFGRPHVEIFNGYSNPIYRNLYSDDFVSRMYEPYPRYNVGMVTPNTFNNLRNRYAIILYDHSKVEITTKQERYRMLKYLDQLTHPICVELFSNGTYELSGVCSFENYMNYVEIEKIKKKTQKFEKKKYVHYGLANRGFFKGPLFVY